MSTTQSDTTNSSGDSDGGTAQVSLTDTTEYLSGGSSESEGETPEDIEREFTVEDTPAVDTLDIPAETIREYIQPDWVPAADLFGGDTAAWQGQLPVDTLTAVTAHLTPRIQEVKIAVHSNGWLLKVVDKKNVCMFRVWLSADDFPTYSVADPGVIAVELDQLAETLSHISGDTVPATVDPEEREIVFDGDATTTLPLFDPDCLRQAPDVPELDINQRIALPGDEFTSVLDRLSAFGTYLDISTDTATDSVIFECESDVLDGEKRYSKPQDVVAADYTDAKKQFECAVTDDVRSVFTYDYLADFTTNLTRNTTQEQYEITFGQEFPMYVRSELSAGSHLLFMLAPRIMPD